jgi:hypothetical protein
MRTLKIFTLLFCFTLQLIAQNNYKKTLTETTQIQFIIIKTHL